MTGRPTMGVAREAETAARWRGGRAGVGGCCCSWGGCECRGSTGLAGADDGLKQEGEGKEERLVQVKEKRRKRRRGSWAGPGWEKKKGKRKKGGSGPGLERKKMMERKKEKKKKEKEERGWVLIFSFFFLLSCIFQNLGFLIVLII